MTPTTAARRCWGLAVRPSCCPPGWRWRGRAGRARRDSSLDGLVGAQRPRLQRSLGEVLSRGVGAPLSVARSRRDAGAGCCCASRRPPRSRSTARAGVDELCAASWCRVRRGRHDAPGRRERKRGPARPRALAPPRYGDAVGAARVPRSAGRKAPGAAACARVARHRTGACGAGRWGWAPTSSRFATTRPDDDIRQVNWRASRPAGPADEQPVPGRAGPRRALPARRRPADGGADRRRDAARRRARRDSPPSRSPPMSLATAAARSRSTRTIRCALEPTPPRAPRGWSQALFDLQPSSVDSDFERAFLAVGGSRGALVLVLTDLSTRRPPARWCAQRRCSRAATLSSSRASATPRSSLAAERSGRQDEAVSSCPQGARAHATRRSPASAAPEPR